MTYHRDATHEVRHGAKQAMVRRLDDLNTGGLTMAGDIADRSRRRVLQTALGRWTSRHKTVSRTGVPTEIEQELRVVARERITVPVSTAGRNGW